MRIGLVVVLLMLSGCASGAGLGGRMAGSDRVRGDAERVGVSGMDSRVEALPLAIAHCARFGRAAQFEGKGGGVHRFRCVAD